MTAKGNTTFVWTIVCFWMTTCCPAQSFVDSGLQIQSIPAEYHLQAYDDCGVLNRQPHIVDGQLFIFPADKVSGSETVKTVCFGGPNFKAEYNGLKTDVDYVVTVTYVTEINNKRVQKLSANSAILHEAYVLPQGKPETLFFKIPAGKIGSDGKLVLEFVCLEGPNAVASEIELWSPEQPVSTLHLEVIAGVEGDLTGSVSGLKWQPVAGAEIVVANSKTVLARAKSDRNGGFRFDAETWKDTDRKEQISLKAVFEGTQAAVRYPLENLYAARPVIRPISINNQNGKLKQILLDGIWQLVRPVPEHFPEVGEENATWKNFKVPGQLLQQGYEIGPDEEFVLLKQFRVPELWSRTRLFLRLEAIHANAEYWLNGHYLGSSEHLYTPVEYEITKFALSDKNILAVKMKQDSVSEQLSHTSKYAFHDLCGIDRSVMIFTKPQLLIESLHIDTILDNELCDAELVIQVKLDDSVGAMTDETSLRLELSDQEGQVSAIAESKIKKDDTRIQLKASVESPRLWNAEKPYLYTLNVNLMQSGKIIEHIKHKVGFRKIEIHGGQLFVNGKSVKLAGVNRHEIDPYTGRADTAKHAKRDAQLFKAANINYIRTSHYPPTREFLDACDEIGLYVEVEAPFCWTRTKRQWEEDQKYLPYFMRPTAAMVEYHRNHPSVILWSIGNESGYAFNEEKYDMPHNYIKTLEHCQKIDPSRPACFNNEWARDGKRCDIAILHYQDPPFKSLPYLQEDDRPIILDEYWHIPTYEPTELSVDPGARVQWGNFGGLDKTIWNRLLRTRNVIGGAIWAGIDEIFFLPDGKKVGYGPWGILDSWRREKPEYWIAKCVYSPVWIPVDQVDYQQADRVVRIPVENRYSFTNLNELKTVWRAGNKTSQLSLDIEPLSKGWIEIPADFDASQSLILKFFDKDDHLVIAKAVRLGEQSKGEIQRPGSGCPTVTEDKQFITVTGKRFVMKIDKQNGQIVSQDSDVALLALPQVHATRKEVGWVGTVTSPYTEYPDTATRKINSVTVQKEANAAVVIVDDEYQDFKGFVKCLIDDSGQMDVSFDYDYTGPDLPAREMGVRFLLDRNCQTFNWKSSSSWGPFPDDHIGRTKGVAQAFYDVENKNSSVPDWPWSYDSTDRGSNDFRSTKFNIYDAQINDKRGNGLKVYSDGSENVRASVSDEGVQFHILETQGIQLTKATKLKGEFNIVLINSKK